MKVAVIGSGGFIGKALVARLSCDGVDVAPFSSQSGNMFDSSTGILNDDFKLPQGTTCVVYLAQSPFYRQMPEKASHLWGVNVISAMKVAELARKAGVTRFIYASTGNVYSPSFLPLSETHELRRDDWYALSKVHAEEGLALYGKSMSVSIARIFGIYGPGQPDKLVPNLIKSVRSGVPIKLAPMPDDDQDCGGLRVSLCYIDDAIDVFIRMLGQTETDIVNIAGPEVLSIRDIAQSIGKELGTPPLLEVGTQPRPFDLVADVAKLVKLFGPRFTPFSEGIRRTLEV